MNEPLERVDEDEQTLHGADAAYASPDYRSTLLRAPDRPWLVLPSALEDTTGPAFGHGTVGEYDNDLTRQHTGEPLGVRTRLYLPGEPANARDPVLTAIRDDDERSTLVAARDGDVLRFDVHLQGARQTAFFRL